MLVAYDCWLRISEVSGLTVADVHDTRGQATRSAAGSPCFLPKPKPGGARL